MHNRNSLRWKQGSASERGLRVVAVSAVLLCIVQAVGTAEALSVQSPAKDAQNVSTQACRDDVCLTPECVRTATTVLNNMDRDVDPCDDFYQFACGKFVKSAVIADENDSVTVITEMEDMVKRQLKAIMEEPSEPNDWKPFKLVKNLYNSCINETAIESQGLEPIHKILKKFGGWPVLDGELWNEADFDWKDLIYAFRKTGYSVDYLIDFKTVFNVRSKTRRMINLRTPDLGLRAWYLMQGINNTEVKVYYDYMVDIAVFLGAKRENANNELLESLLFEIDLANISRPNLDSFNPAFFNPKNLEQLTTTYPSIPWREYFEKLMPNNVTVETNDVVNIGLPYFISDLEKLLHKTPKRVQANYLIWRAVKDSVKYLNNNIRMRELAFMAAVGLKSHPKGESRWQHCVDFVSKGFPKVTDTMYVVKYFNGDIKQNVIDIITDIKKQFTKIIEQVKWMDENMRQSASERAAAISSYVLYPEEPPRNKELEKMYENLELSEGSYLDNILKLGLFHVDTQLGKFHDPVILESSHPSPTVVQAYYQWAANSIHVPAGIIQGAFFGSDRPKYMNYGGIGFVIGHEITRSFDLIRIQIERDGDPNGLLTTKESYLKEIECIIHQYGNYTVQEVELNLNGIQTRDRNIADNAGIKEAYLAYKDWVKRNGREKKLPGLPYSPNQMFWISTANKWCAKMGSEKLKNYIKKDRHSAAKFRTIGPLSNMPEFSKDFDCPIGSKMNPEKKCSVW